MSIQKRPFDAWKQSQHAAYFDHRMYFPKYFLRKNFEVFNEMKILKGLKSRKDKFSLLDIGCATGEFSRYFRYQFPNIDYSGCDISPGAIKRAREKFPNEHYLLLDEKMSQLSSQSVDIVFCRDVILHQPDPFEFLGKICDLESKYILMRLRTRDVGATILDLDRSCQLSYGKWAPYMILNCDEIVEYVRQRVPSVFRITFVKNYIPLGGHYWRYLPKDCYLSETKTSETALLIEKNDRTNAEIDVKNLIQLETCGPMIAAKVSAKAIHFLYRQFRGKRVWW